MTKEMPAANQRSSFGRLVRAVSLPNVLTCVRILLIPVFLWLILSSGDWQDGGSALTHRWWALASFILLMFTDQLDGFLARKYEIITDFGKLADPIADKALMISALVSLNILGDLWWWVTIVIVVRELGVTALRFVMIRRSVMAASRGGKLKTVTQMLFIFLMLIPWDGMGLGAAGEVAQFIATAVMWVALAITVVTGLEYCISAYRIAREGR